MKKIILPLLLATSLIADNNYIKKDFFKTSVNWGENVLEGIVNETIPNVVFDPDDPEYGREDTVYNLTEARNAALNLAKKRLNILLFRAIENLTFDNETLIRDNISVDEEYREKFNEIFQTGSINYSVKYKKNKVYVSGKFKLTGTDSLINYLKINFPGEPFPEYQPLPISPEYTGLVIDARHLDAQPALLPRILADNGSEIYSSRFVDRSAALQKGMAVYLTDPKEALERTALIGKKPFYVLALNAAGKYKTDLVIPGKEAVKLLASEKTRNHLKKCKVIILLKN